VHSQAADEMYSTIWADDYYARQHICYSAYMLSPVRPSVCLSVRKTGVRPLCVIGPYL